MTRANTIVDLYQRFNTKRMDNVPPVDITVNSLSNLRTIEVLNRIHDQVFLPGEPFPSEKHSINFQLQVREVALIVIQDVFLVRCMS